MQCPEPSQRGQQTMSQKPPRMQDNASLGWNVMYINASVDMVHLELSVTPNSANHYWSTAISQHLHATRETTSVNRAA